MTVGSLIPRTCTEIVTDERDSAVFGKPVPLSAYRDVPAYVLLGEPGAGKTTEFEQERRALGTRAEWISARRFAKADIATHPEWRDKVLFIDGLDETRAGARDATTALDEIQSKLDALGQPRFRISCRSADWLGPVDRRPLAEVSPDGQMMTLSLDLLDRSAVLEHLKSHPDARDPAAFVQAVASSGLDFMLNNPLLLKLLIAAASEADGGPSSRREVFERACRTLATEHNRSHPRSMQPCAPEAVFATAGRLCAIQLLASKEGYALAPTPADVEFVSVADVTSDVAAMSGLRNLRPHEVFTTNLFMGAGEQHVVPVHRQIAEYLGASHLADLIGRGIVPVGRVCAALTSPLDNQVVTDLRGLSAWIGMLAAPARTRLIEADPLGMALYGDILEWPVEDRRTLLDRLAVQARPEDLWGTRWFDTTEHRYRDATGRGFRSLCNPDMIDTISSCLDDGQRGVLPEHVWSLILRALSESETQWLDELIALAPRLEQLLCGPRVPAEVRLSAVTAYWRLTRTEALRGIADRHLLKLLDEITDGRIDDPDWQVAGTLLRLLYPDIVPPSEIWRYVTAAPKMSLVGRYWNFAIDVLPNQASKAQLTDLLHAFAGRSPDRSEAWSSVHASDIARKVLLRALRECAANITASDLYDWMLAIDAQQRHSGNRLREDWSDVVTWLRDRPHMHKSLVQMWLVDDIENRGHRAGHWETEEPLFSSLPDDFINWCATQACESAGTDTALAHAFVELPIRYCSRLKQSRDETIEILRSKLATQPLLLRHLDEYLAPAPARREFAERVREHQREIDEIRAEHESKRQQRQSDWRALLRESHDELATNRFSAPSLHALALAYLGRLVLPQGLSHPRARVAELIGDNAELLDAAMEALRNAPLRDDLPTAERTAALAAESKHDWLVYPVLAGMDLREGNLQLGDSLFTEGRRRDVVAIYASHGWAAFKSEFRPAWPVHWLRSNPRLVLDVCHRSALAGIKHGDTHLSMLSWLVEVDGHDDELRDFRLRLLKSISVRLPVVQLPIVDRLLHSVAEHPDRAALGALVAEKLRATSMTDAQRVRWLVVDAIMHGGDALEALDEFIDANEKRPQHLAALLSDEFRGSRGLVDRLLGSEAIPVRRTLVSVVGRTFPPRAWGIGEDVSVGPAEDMSDFVRQWIVELGGHPVDEASTALDALMADERLSAWHDSLEFAHNRQRRLRRDASYPPMSVAEVLDLLRNGSPASVADLHALLEDHLRDLGGFIRGDNTDPWREFWEDERSLRPSIPRHEETGRDALLRMLRPRLPERVDAQPEGQYAADRRADIRVSFKNFNVPVEIKKNSHQDLWTAIEEQLIAKYMTDPDTGGYGIYAVLWFGSEIDGYRGHPPDGDRPETPDDLERMLSESLSHEQRRRISVIVLDVTKP